MEAAEKKCSKCGEVKPLEAFSPSKTGRLGRVSACKACSAAARRADRIVRADEISAVRTAWWEKNKASINEARRNLPVNRLEARRARRRETYPSRRELVKGYNKRYHDENRDVLNAASRAYYEAHKQEQNANSRAYHTSHQDAVSAMARAWRLSNRGYIAEKSREAYRDDPAIRIRQSMSTSVRRALKGGKGGTPTFELLGYTLDDLRAHLERQFTVGMSWANYGRYGWHIDHIRPQASFSISDPTDAEFKACWALSNLQPLWWRDNIVKGDRWTPPIADNDNNGTEQLDGRCGPVNYCPRGQLQEAAEPAS